MKQTPLLEFESSAFPVIPGEDDETNPGIYGKALAQWLAEQLRETQGTPEAADLFESGKFPTLWQTFMRKAISNL
jgi:hypothetical protein